MMLKKTIAIIGAGPRGLSALESIVRIISGKNAQDNYRIILCDDTIYRGAGPNHAPDLLDANRINLSEREITIGRREALDLGGFEIGAFPSYAEWSDVSQDMDAIDSYPPRAKLGMYLSERYLSIAIPLANSDMLINHNGRINEIEYGSPTHLHGDEFHVSCDELVLCLGHLPVEADDQMAGWIAHPFPKGVHLQQDPYPVKEYIDKLLADHDKIAVRGFGLTFLDIVTAAATRIGEFELMDSTDLTMRYTCTGRIENCIIPFSTDGLPPIPKPISKRVFDRFAPSEGAMARFEAKLNNGMADQPDQFLSVFIDAMAELSAGVYHRIDTVCDPETIYKILRSYMYEEAYHYPFFANHDQHTESLIRDYCVMASDQIKPSLDYCLGQVWRHCRLLMYDLFWHPDLPDNVLKEVIDLDERMKRYTYGPPLNSLRELLAVHDAGMVSFAYVDDPDISLDGSGWTLTNSQGCTIITTAMVDSVLSPPDISKTTTPLVRDLMKFCSPFFDLGGITDKQAMLPDCPGNVALLGRLAKGRVFGTDSIRECFSAEVDFWAEGLVARTNA